MLVLFETPAGFALFKVLDEGKLSKVEDLWKEFSTSDAARKVVTLKAFSKFENITEALAATTLLIDSKPSKGLRKFLHAHCEGETLAVADTKLGKAIQDKLKIECVHNNAVMELMRGVRHQLMELIAGLGPQDLAPMSLGLSHSMSRHKLKFSPDKVDIMLIQAIGNMDDLDKELNISAMRLREWYGWHFPELAKILQDNILYAKTVKMMRDRTNAAKLDFSEIMSEELEIQFKEAAMISMGTEVCELDLNMIVEQCDQVISLAKLRAELYDYLKSRMNAVAPNLTALVGELVGARLIAHAGSLINLAKQPGSTTQILGAEKALFRALKQKHATPKFGLIYHASLIGQASAKHKGKISRSLAAKTALAVRCDAFGDDQDNSIGLENRAKLELRLMNLEGKELGRSAGSAKGKPKMELYNKDRKKGAGALITPAKTYNPSADSVIGQKEPMTPIKVQIGVAGKEAPVANEEKKEKKTNKREKKADAEETGLQNDAFGCAEPVSRDAEIKLRKKKMKQHAVTEDVELQSGGVKANVKKNKKREHPGHDEETEKRGKKKE
ncbi:hypothetical protein RJ639_003832 [Escallonia herrerae]|uniref:Nucleolar protein 58 n=1 Tax=Escallonia herrerae TaxID=1293975 RepID=A0AA88W022_9ASTE|nr:hypothetical protein RJ639_003832 [Escallonia herrerae]